MYSRITATPRERMFQFDTIYLIHITSLIILVSYFGSRFMNIISLFISLYFSFLLVTLSVSMSCYCLFPFQVVPHILHNTWPYFPRKIKMAASWHPAMHSFRLTSLAAERIFVIAAVADYCQIAIVENFLTTLAAIAKSGNVSPIESAPLANLH